MVWILKKEVAMDSKNDLLRQKLDDESRIPDFWRKAGLLENLKKEIEELIDDTTGQPKLGMLG